LISPDRQARGVDNMRQHPRAYPFTAPEDTPESTQRWATK
jgi:hypothetical protein